MTPPLPERLSRQIERAVRRQMAGTWTADDARLQTALEFAHHAAGRGDTYQLSKAFYDLEELLVEKVAS